MSKPAASVVVLDLDNTLYDWVDVWYQGFRAMLGELVRTSGAGEDELLTDFKTVFQRRGTSEYSFAIQELQCLRDRYPQDSWHDLAARFGSARHAYHSARLKALRLYPSVGETLEALRAHGCLLVGYTESMAYYTNRRVRRLDLDLVLDLLYSPEDHEHDLPIGVTVEELRKYDPDEYLYRHTIQRFTPTGELKPNAHVLLSILADCSAAREDSIYVGDSKMKDMVMAQQAGVIDVHAAYGSAQHLEEYELLRRVTHWPAEHVKREMQQEHVTPTYVLRERFSELLDLFEFQEHKDRDSVLGALRKSTAS